LRPIVLAIAGRLQLIWWRAFVSISSRRLIFASVCFLILRSDLSGLEPSERSVAPSGQFVIYGADAGYRGAISALAERTKAELLAVLKRRDSWKIPIVINLQPRAVNVPEIPAAEFRFSQTEVGLKLQLDLAISPELRPAAIECELARVILLEMIYRNQTGVVSGNVYVDPPNWLVNGLLAASALNPDRVSLVSLVSALSAPQRIISLHEFLEQRRESLDSAARELYRAYSFVLVQLLTESSDGRARLNRYIDNLGFASNDPVADLVAAFPTIRDFETVWKAKIAEVRDSHDHGLLTFSQTDARLSEILNAEFPSADGRGKTRPLDAFSRTKPTPAQRLAIQKFGQQLLLLAAHANPVLRPVIQDYQQIASQLALGKNHAIGARLDELKALRTKLSARMSDVDDYMNWFEAARLQTRSGIFDDYLKAADDMSGQRPKRRDRLSVYLDAVEQEF
jgi:hypothetical protein